MMPQAKPQIRHLTVDNGLSNDRFLGLEPGMLILLPDIHRPAHDPQRFIAIEAWQALAFIKLNRVPAVPVTGQEITKNTGMLEPRVL